MAFYVFFFLREREKSKRGELIQPGLLSGRFQHCDCEVSIEKSGFSTSTEEHEGTSNQFT